MLIASKGDSTRFLSYLLRFSKTYLAEISLGSETDTLDNTGSLVKEMPVPELGPEVLVTTKDRFTGKILQIPPLYSNVQVDGWRGHEAARAGKSIDLKPRQVEVHELSLRIVSHHVIQMRCTVGSGTYIRSLARDIGAALGTCGHLSALRRVAIGPFSVSDAVPEPQSKGGVLVREVPDAEGLDFIERLDLDNATARRFYQGSIPVIHNAGADGLRRIFCAGNFLGLGRLEADRLLVERIYPQSFIESFLL